MSILFIAFDIFLFLILCVVDIWLLIQALLNGKNRYFFYTILKIGEKSHFFPFFGLYFAESLSKVFKTSFFTYGW